VDVREIARAFVAGAFGALRKEFVIPTPVFHPYLQVGRDYFGDTSRSVPAYHDLTPHEQEDQARAGLRSTAATRPPAELSAQTREIRQSRPVARASTSAPAVHRLLTLR